MKFSSVFTALMAVLLFPLPLPASAQGFHLKGLISPWFTARFDGPFEPVFSLRLIPEASFSFKAGRDVSIDAEASANAFGSASFFSGKENLFQSDLQPYRAWLRFSTSRFEARVGLQKVNFGSASLFRPLMWFDSIDPRDPLQITDGVYALLLRYYTKGNANFWAWSMVGNGKARGWDIAPPDKKSPEFGGRIQVPVFKGELAATYHHRRADLSGLVPLTPLRPISPVPEDRFAVDGKWDLGVGVWFEGSLTHQRTPLLPLSYQRALTLGLDYTFGWGNGLNFLAEHFRLESSSRAFESGEGRSFSALLLRYPLGLLDEVTGIFYYDWKSRNVYRFLSWKRTYDAISYNIMLFWNPKELVVFQGQPGSGSFAGTGFQLLLAYHF
jgi:hypothetical protein